jgi:carboxyl-terminal processing protease
MQQFSDGSALKFTQAAWLSPSGKSIQDVGVKPDFDVSLHPVLTTQFYEFVADESFLPDSVSEAIKDAQLCLDFMGYSVDRQDGYYSAATETALNSFKTSIGLEADSILSKAVLSSLQSAMVKTWYTQQATKDTQMIKALELING